MKKRTGINHTNVELKLFKNISIKNICIRINHTNVELKSKKARNEELEKYMD